MEPAVTTAVESRARTAAGAQEPATHSGVELLIGGHPPARRVIVPMMRAFAAIVARAIGQSFDRRNGVITGDAHELSRIGIDSDSFVHATEYAPTSTRAFWLSVGSLRIDFRKFSFVDLGSGKGRAVLLATKLPFHSIVGVEFARELHEIACRNVQIACGPSGRSRIELLHADAVDFDFPSGPLIVYLFNPFGASILSRIVDKLKASFILNPRPIFIVYMNPAHRGVFDERHFQVLPRLWFDFIAQTPFAIFYLRSVDRELNGVLLPAAARLTPCV